MKKHFLAENYERFFGPLKESSESDLKTKLLSGIIKKRESGNGNKQLSKYKRVNKVEIKGNSFYVYFGETAKTYFVIDKNEVNDLIEYGESENYIFNSDAERM